MAPPDLFLMLEIADRLEARERIRRISDQQIGSGMAKDQVSVERYMRNLEQQAAGPDAASDRRRTSGSAVDLSGMGIQVVKVDADG